MSGNSIEVPVRLSLEQAQSQAEALRRILQESVQPNSSEYKAIINMIERAATQAERLKQTMEESFKTSSGSKKFNSELQKTFDLLATATGRLKDVSGKNLILSPEEATRAKEIAAEIQKLQDEISNIQTGKIGNFFDDSSKEEFKNIQELAQKFTSDLSNMTFSGLSDRLTKELGKVNNDLEEAKQKTKELTEAQAKTEVTTNKDNFINNLIQQTRDATKLSAASASTLENQLTSLFSEYQHLFNGEAFEIGNINKTSSVSEILQNQLVAVENAITPQIAKIEAEIQKYQEAINKINNIKTEGFQRGGKGAAESRKSAMSMRDLANQAGVQVRERKSGESLADYQKDIVATLNSQMEQALSSKELFINAQDQLNRRIGEIFNNIGANTTIRTGGFKRIVETWLQGAGIDTGSNEIKLALTKMIEGANVGSTLEGLASALTTHFSQGLQDAATQENQASVEAQQLKQALQTLGGIFEINNGKIEINKKRLQELAEEQDKVFSGAHGRLGKSLDENPAITGATQQYNQATEALKNYANGLANLESKQKALGNVQNAVTRWMGFYQVLNLTKQAVNEMKQHIQELDSVMTQIAVVTNMSQDDLWGQIKQYSEIARQYGVAIKGVYEVSQIYYQQGLNKGDVMGLTTETLKMARIAGLDYATAADYMTTAIRGFKLEMTDAAHVTDVYSALAAKTASSTEELAVAISKTASSAEAVGSSFEATSAMMATMIATTRESATNIGTALKSVISRYGEMTSDPSKLVDSEGEEMSLNRVDKALQTVGITIHDVNGQFRDFDDVILELGEKWDTLDKNSQRYIATLMAGNRQQSRFLALVGNVDEYKNALEIAQNSEDAGELQTLKILDSVDAKIERMKVNIQEFYTSSGIQDLYKGILDTITNVIDAANNLPKAFGKIPLTALAIGGQVISAIKNILKLIINTIQVSLSDIRLASVNNLVSMVKDSEAKGEEGGKAYKTGFQRGIADLGGGNFATGLAKYITSIVSSVLSTFGAGLTVSALNDYGKSTSSQEDRAAGGKSIGGGVLSGLGGAASGAMMGFSVGHVPGAIIGAIAGFATSGLPAIISGIDMINVTLARQLELDTKKETKAKQDLTIAKGDQQDLQSAADKLKQLEQAQYDSAEAAAEYKEYMNQLADSYPTLVSQLEVTGDRIITVASLEEALANARLATAEATVSATEAEITRLKDEQNNYNAILEAVKAIPNGELITPEEIISIANKRYSTNEEITGNQETDEKTARKILSKMYRENNEAYMANGVALDDFYQNNTYKDFYGSNTQLAARRFKIGNPKDITSLPTVQEDSLKKLVEVIDNSFTDFNYKQFFGYEKSDLLKLSGEKLSEALEKATNLLNDQINSTTDAINSSSEALGQANILVQLEKDIKDSKNGERLKGIEKYSKFITTYATSDTLSTFENFVAENLNNMDNILQSLDFKQIKNISEIDQITANFPDEVSGAIIEGYKNYFVEANTEFQKVINNSTLGQNSDFKQLFDEMQNDQIILQLYPFVQSAITEYNKLEEENLTVAANNYKNNLLGILTFVSKLSGSQQSLISPILSDLDLTDYDDVQTAIDNLNNLGPEYKTLVELLQGAQQQIVRNTATWAEELYSKAKDTSKEIEDILGNVGKGMSYSSALEEAQKLVNAGVKSNPQDLITFDNELGQYVLTDDAIQAALAAKQEKRAAEIQNLVKQNERMLQLVGVETNENGEEKATGKLLEDSLKFMKKSFSWTNWIEDIFKGQGLKPDEIVGLAAKAEEIYRQSFDENGQFDQSKFSEAIIAAAKAMGKIDETFLNNIDKYSALAEIASMDFAGLVSRTIDKNTFKTQLQNYLVALGGTADQLTDDIWNQVLSGNLEPLENLIKGYGLEDFSFSSKLKDSINEANISKYQTAISETLNASTAPISAATAELIGQADKAHQKIEDAAFDSIGKAIEFLNSIKNSLSIEDYNKSAREILEKSLVAGETTKKQGSIAQAMDFATSNLDLSSFETLANNFGVELSNWFNLQTGEVFGKFANVVSYNKFTGTFDIIGTVDEFISAVEDATGTIIDKETAEYAQLYSDIVDKKITAKKSKTAAISKQIEQMQSLADAKVGDILNVSYLDDLLTEPMIKLLEEAGVTIEDGIATIGENFNLKEVLNTLTSIDTSGSTQLADAVAKLNDSIVDMINNWTSLIANGIEGKLSNAGKSELQKIANEQLNITLDDSAFTRTKDGLKLSQQAAIELYNALKQVDSIAAQITFDNLKKSLEDNNENYQSVSSIMAHIKDLQDKINSADSKTNAAKKQQYEQELAIAKEILAVRSQTDDDSFKFMDQALPGGQNNPLNYYDAMNKANKAISDAFNMKEGGGKGYMGYQDFYNIVTEINQMAAVSKQKIKIGAYTLSGNMQDAANLIQAGASALASVDGGEMKVNLGQLGIDMQAGASQMRNGLNSGLKTMAQEQIKMLDAAIAMLEAIVAMQEIGDIGGIDLSLDINEDGVFDPSDLFSDDGMKKAQQYLDQIALWADISIDGKGLGTALSDLAKNGEEGAQKVFEFFQELNKMLTDPDFDFSNFSTDFNNLLAKTFNSEKIDISQGIFSKLGISSTDMGKSLYKRISDAYTKTTKDPNIINNLIKDIGKKNKDLAKNLQAAQKVAGKGASFSAIMEIAEKIQSKGKIEEDTKNNTVTAKYGKNSKTFNGKNAKILAQNWIASEAQKEAENAAKSTKNNKFKPPVQAVKVEGLTEVAYMTEVTDKNGKKHFEATFHGVKMTADTPEKLRAKLEKAISEWADGAGSFTYNFGKSGKTVTVKTINGIEYRQYFNKNGETTHYIMNGKVYKNVAAFQKFLEEKAKTDTNADVTISDDGNTINVNTNSGVKYKIKIDSDGKEHYYIGNAEYTKKQLDKYLEEQAKAKANGSTISVTKDSENKKDGIITVTSSGKAQYKIKIEPNGKITYLIGNQEVSEAVMKNIFTLQAEGAITKKYIVHPSGNITVEAKHHGIDYKITYNSNGEVIRYEYNGVTYGSEGDLKKAFEEYLKLKDTLKGKVEIDDKGGITVTTSSGKKVKFVSKLNKEGERVWELNGQEYSNLSDLVKEYNKQNPNDPVEGAAPTVELEDGVVKVKAGSVILATEKDGELELTENLTQVTGDAQQALLKILKALANGDIPDLEQIEELKGSLAKLIVTSILNIDPGENKELGTISTTGLTATLAALGITTVEQLSQAADMTITGKQIKGEITDENVTGILAELGITDTNELINKIASLPITNWSNLDNDGQITATLNNLGINDPGVVTFTDAAISILTGKPIEISNIVKGAATGVQLSNTSASFPAGTILSFVDVDEAKGTVSTVTITEVTNNKKLNDTDNYTAKDITGTVDNANITANSYKITYKTKNKDGIEVIAGSVTVSADVLFGGKSKLQDYLNTQDGLKTPEIEVIISSLQKAIDAQGPLTAQVQAVPPEGGGNNDGQGEGNEKHPPTPSTQDNQPSDQNKDSAPPSDKVKVDADTDPLKTTVKETVLDPLKVDVDGNTDPAKATVQETVFNPLKVDIDGDTDPVKTTVKGTALDPLTVKVYGQWSGYSVAGGRVGGNGGGIDALNRVLAHASGNALASGTKTLMGELGPELVVSHGHYFVAGQNGAEFVDLDKDAIVFNHLQTESLLKNGKGGRGKAKTNERNAIGMATGNVSGPALAGAQAALANLRQIRAMWESLLSASVQDLAQKGGGGGGGGGGGKNGNNAAWLADVERWYNWLQRIAQLEKDINYEETLRSKIQSDRNVNGKAYVDSLVRQLEATKEEEKYQASLADSQEAFFKKRRNEMNKSAFSKFYTFDEDGQLKYTEKSKLKNGDKGGFAALSDLMATNPDGSTKYTAEQQYNKIKAWGFGSTMLYDSSGKKITDENQKKGKHSDEFFTQSVQAFWDKIESDKEEMQKLRDSIDDANTKVLEMEQKRNELIKEMRDNQMDLEDKIMDALQNKLQSKIDEMQKKRDAYDKANQKFIKGLQDSLAREQDMYQRQEDKTELSKMRRQLAILQRSGGSASSIASLQNDIREREKDQYFDERQAQIDAIQTASDKQLEKMDLQISIAQETLDYQKRMGLLWSQVYDIMGGSGNSILNFLSKYSTDFTSLSTLGQEDLKGQWKAQIDEYKRWQQKQQDNEVGQKWNVAKGAIKQSKLYSKVYGTGYEYTNSKGEKVNVDKAAKAEFERVYKNTGDENKARQAAAKVYSDAQKQYEKENPTKPAKQPTKEPGKTDDKKGGKGDKGGNKGTYLTTYVEEDGKRTSTVKKKVSANYVVPRAPKKSGFTATTKYGSGISGGRVLEGHHGTVTYSYTRTSWTAKASVDYKNDAGKIVNTKEITGTGKTKDAAYSSLKKNATKQAKNNTKAWIGVPKYYKRGGQVDYTGLAQVDGTPSRPEAFFNAEQTKILKNGLLGNSSRILASTLEEFNSIVEGMANGATYNTIDRGSSLVIENASVNMNVQSIANDYDARRAGEQALEQMMKIARKSGTKGVSRR